MIAEVDRQRDVHLPADDLEEVHGEGARFAGRFLHIHVERNVAVDLRKGKLRNKILCV